MKIKCPKCEGSGQLPSNPDPKAGGVIDYCSLCHGEGKVDPAELFEVLCEDCKGTGAVPFLINDGEVDMDLCETCQSTGWRPMTADEVEKLSHKGITWDEDYNAVSWNGEQVTLNGKPVRLRENS